MDATGAFICYVGKHEVATCRERIRIGKKIAKLNRAIARCAKWITEYQSKLSSAEQTKALTVAAPSSRPRPQDDLAKESGVSEPEDKPYTTVESASWVVSEAA